jgi:hypothetical protein
MALSDGHKAIAKLRSTRPRNFLLALSPKETEIYGGSVVTDWNRR